MVSGPTSGAVGRLLEEACKCGARFVPRIPRVLRAEILRLGADRPARRLQVRGKIRTTNPASSPCRNLTYGGGSAHKTLASAGQDSYHESREFSVPKSYVWGRSGPQDACKCGARFVPRIPRVLRAEVLRWGRKYVWGRSGPQDACKCGARFVPRITRVLRAEILRLGAERPARRLQVRGKIRTTNPASSPCRNLTSGGGAARKTLASAGQDSYHESREFSVPKSYVWGRSGPQDACKCGARFVPRIPRVLRAEILRLGAERPARRLQVRGKIRTTNPASSPCRNLTSGGGAARKTLASAGQDSYHESREISVPRSCVEARRNCARVMPRFLHK